MIMPNTSYFNAKVGVMDDVLVPDRQVLEGSGIPCQRGCSHPSVNLHGHLLVDLCLATSTLLETGRVPEEAASLGKPRPWACSNQVLQGQLGEQVESIHHQPGRLLCRAQL